MRAFLIAVLLFFVASQGPPPTPGKVSKPQQQNAKATQKAPAYDQRGTENSPLVVKTIPPPKLKVEADQETKDRDAKAANDWHLVLFSGILSAIAFGQLLVYAYQAKKLKETVKSAGEQSKAMERHIGEAARSATAMEEIANVIQSGNKAIIRAYLSVVIGGAIYQEREDGVKFEGKPNLVNTGSTPAKNVHVRIAAELVPRENAEAFVYPLPDEVAKAPAVAAPHQTYMLSAMVKNFAPDPDIPSIKQGQGPALTVWGVVTYDDIFGDTHSTKFGQWLFWYPNQAVYGYYIPGQNDMD